MQAAARTHEELITGETLATSYDVSTDGEPPTASPQVEPSTKA